MDDRPNSGPVRFLAGWGPRVWLAFLLAVLEVVALGLLFDGENLIRRGGSGALLAGADDLFMVLVGIIAGTIIVEFLQPDGLQHLRSELTAHRPRWPFWMLHGLALLVLLAVSRVVFDPRGAQAGPVTSVWLLLWIGAALVAMGSLVRCVLPFAAVVRLLFRARKTLVVGVAAGFSAWALGLMGDQAFVPLARVTLGSVVSLLDHVEPEVIYDPGRSLIGTPQFAVTMAPMCSGFNGIGLFWVFFALLLRGAWEELRVRRAVWLFPIGAVLVWLGNVVRIALLILLGTHGSARIATGAFHSKAGWLFFCLLALGMVILVRRMPFFLQRPSERKGSWNPTAVYLMPLLVQLACAMASGMFVAEVDRAYALRVVGVAVTLYWLRRWFPRPRFDLHWLAIGWGLLGYVIWILLETNVDVTRVELARAELFSLGRAEYLAWVAARVIGSVVLVAIAEELAFRGFLVPRLIRSDFLAVPPRQLTWLSLLGSSLAFGLVHERWLAATACGVLYALARRHRGRLLDAITAHGVTNALIAADVLWRGHYSLWL